MSEHCILRNIDLNNRVYCDLRNKSACLGFSNSNLSSHTLFEY